MLRELLGNSHLAAASEKIKALESSGDEITHDIFTRLNQTFITPLDPEIFRPSRQSR